MVIFALFIEYHHSDFVVIVKIVCQIENSINGKNIINRFFCSRKIKKFFDENGYPEKTELLPYHAMGEHKYRALGKDTEIFNSPDKEKIAFLKETVQK